MTKQSLELLGKNLKSPIFIGGCGRSGTTLIRNILGHNQNIYEIPEDTFIFREHKTKVYTLISNFERSKDTENLIKSILTIMFYGLDSIEQFKNAIQIISNKTYTEKVQDIFNKLRHLNEYNDVKNKFEAFNLCANYLTIESNKIRWTEKTAGNIRTFKTILRYYPDANLIHIYRDPRAVFSSWKNRSYFKDTKIDNIIACTLMWLIAIYKGKKYLKSAPNQIYQVSYEKLVQDPEAEIKKICLFLNESFNKEMLTTKVMNSSFTDFNSEEGFSSIPLDRWKKVLSREELLFLDLTTKSYRKDLGYLDADIDFKLTDIFTVPVFLIKIFFHAVYVFIYKSKQHFPDWFKQKIVELSTK